MTGGETSDPPKRFAATPRVTMGGDLYASQATARSFILEGPEIPNWVSVNLGIECTDAEIEVEIVGAGHEGGHDRNAPWHLNAVMKVDGEPMKTKDHKGRETRTWHVEGIAKNTEDFRDKSSKWLESERKKRDNPEASSVAIMTRAPTSESVVEGSPGSVSRSSLGWEVAHRNTLEPQETIEQLANEIGKFDIERTSNDGGGNPKLKGKDKAVPPKNEKNKRGRSKPWNVLQSFGMGGSKDKKDKRAASKSKQDK